MNANDSEPREMNKPASTVSWRRGAGSIRHGVIDHTSTIKSQQPHFSSKTSHDNYSQRSGDRNFRNNRHYYSLRNGESDHSNSATGGNPAPWRNRYQRSLIQTEPSAQNSPHQFHPNPIFSRQKRFVETGFNHSGELREIVYTTHSVSAFDDSFEDESDRESISSAYSTSSSVSKCSDLYRDDSNQNNWRIRSNDSITTRFPKWTKKKPAYENESHNETAVRKVHLQSDYSDCESVTSNFSNRSGQLKHSNQNYPRNRAGIGNRSQGNYQRQGSSAGYDKKETTDGVPRHQKTKFTYVIADGNNKKNQGGADATSESQQGVRYVGFKYLETLSAKDAPEITFEILNPNTAFTAFLAQRDLQPEWLFLVVKIVSKVCSSEFTNTRNDMLNQICRSEFLRSISYYLGEVSVEKRKSTIEKLPAFTSDLIVFYSAVVNFLPGVAVDKDFSKLIAKSVKCVESMKADHRLEVDENFVPALNTLNEKLEDHKKMLEKPSKPIQNKKAGYLQYLSERPPPDDFRELDLYPTYEDLTRHSFGFVRPNKVRGAYDDVGHYLDVQFRLLREDFIDPLRRGLNQYLEARSAAAQNKQNVRLKFKYESLRLYPNCVFEEIVTTEKNLVAFRLNFNPHGKIKIKWENSKRFMYGSLLLFTNDCFETFFYGIVLDRNMEQLKAGNILVKFPHDVRADKNILSKEFLMAESEVFFEPYFLVMKGLKTLDEKNFPMKEYIVDGNSRSNSPSYLHHPDELEWSIFGDEVDPLNVVDWPNAAALGMDPHQHSAFVKALTSEFCIIQGPPGTGKTFIGLKIVEACKYPCRQLCPPCGEPCGYQCKHSKCPKKCGVPCKPCLEPCDWKCPHLKCTKKCGEMCDRAPCQKACPESLECGHACVGFCGEPHPPCRECYEEMQEIFFGDEGNDDAKFVLLEDCGHSFESKGLEKFLKITPQGGEIVMKVCPRCRTPITRTLRYTNYVKKTYADVHEVKLKIFGTEATLKRRKKDLYKKLLMFSSSSAVNIRVTKLERVHTMVDEYVRKLDVVRNKKRNTISHAELNTVEFFYYALVDIESRLEDLCEEDDERKTRKLCENDLVARILEFVNAVLGRLQEPLIQISEQLSQDAGLELQRYHKMVDLARVLRNPMYAQRKNDPVVSLLLQTLKDYIFGIERFDRVEYNVNKTFEKLQQSLEALLPLTSEEKRMINEAMSRDFFNGATGHWFTCSNGHYYVITECGGPMVKSNCPECGEVIGGEDHRHVQTARLATDMDDATRPACGNVHDGAYMDFLENQLH